MNNLDLLKIRSLNGGQHFSFEELCCQLASIEAHKSGDVFIRKGRGSDAGIECYIQYKDGSETAWQAKFFDHFDSDQASQLTKSFKQAVEKHPNLTRYIICLPIDLKDGRTGKNKTEGQRWLDWKEKRQNELPIERKIEIELWQASSIRERLFRNDPHYAGRMYFFFSELYFSKDWFKEKFKLARDALGNRYTPEFHISLPIRQVLRGLSRDSLLDEQCEGWSIQFLKYFNPIKIKLQSIHLLDSELVINLAKKLIASFSKSYSLTEVYPIDAWREDITKLEGYIDEYIEYFWQEEKKSENSKEQSETIKYNLNQLFQFKTTLHGITKQLCLDVWRLSNEQAVLIYGKAGSGKSHLLADIANDVITKGHPAILLISSQFCEQDHRRQILEKLDLSDTNFAKFLAALDAAGQASGVRALLIIDALNERHGIALWSQHLVSLITEIKNYSHLALIVSCRTTYLDFIISPNSELDKNLPRIEHLGFVYEDGHAAHAYLAKRKIARPSVPNLLPEFNNPLFLKTCCDHLDRKRLNCFPRGIHGLTQYFNFYFSGLSDAIRSRMKLDKRQKIVERALDKLTSFFLKNGCSYLPIQEVMDCFERVYPSNGLEDRSLLNELEHEGIIAIEPVYTTDVRELSEQVRFTFERFSDFKIAEALLTQHIQAGHTLNPLIPNSPLHNFLTCKNISIFAGVMEALAVLLPEQTDFEILDLSLSDSDKSYYSWIVEVERAFLDSLLLRRQDRFTERTKQLILDLSSNYYPNYWLDTLIAISTEPDNIFNANYLHNKLLPLSMSERDMIWSIDIANKGVEEDESSLNILLSWAVESGFDEIEPSRAELTAIILTWLFSTSHRVIRDKATKSLSALLAPRLPLAVKLIEKFKTVDDLYILERLLAACYGAVLQAKTKEGLIELANSIYQWIFIKDVPPIHLLLRDYARGIIEFTKYCELLPNNIILEKVRPPYFSDWPIEVVSEDDLLIYGSDYIVRSAGSEWTGDFAKYIIKYAIHHWTVTRFDFEKTLNSSECFQTFKRISEDYSSEQLTAFSNIHSFCIDVREQGLANNYFDQNSPTRKRFTELEKIFLDLLDNQCKYDYWTLARPYLQTHLILNVLNPRHEIFDASLAQRWITKRAHELGWRSDYFGEFDNRIGSGRGRPNKHIERIGKKYQWLALYELLARMADNLIYTETYSNDCQQYNGSWQIGLRNIDPSLLISKTQYNAWSEQPFVWWSPQALKLRSLNRAEQRLWLENDHDQLNSELLLDIIEPDTNQHWLVLKGFKDYSTPFETGARIDSWCRIWCVVVQESELTTIIDVLSERNLLEPHAFPNVSSFNHGFIGEYPWHPSYEEIQDGWQNGVLPTVSQYSAESNNYDYSVEKSISFHLPAPWIIKKLNLRLIDGQKLHYADQSDKIVFKDPSVQEVGPSTALIDKDTFLNLLKQENLVPIWIIAGEKGAYGEHDRDFIGRRIHSSIYLLDNDRIICHKQKIECETFQKTT